MRKRTGAARCCSTNRIATCVDSNVFHSGNTIVYITATGNLNRCPSATRCCPESTVTLDVAKRQHGNFEYHPYSTKNTATNLDLPATIRRQGLKAILRTTRPELTMSDRIIVACSFCQRNMSVPASAVGKKIRCPKCETVTDVPAESAVAPKAQLRPTSQPSPERPQGRPQAERSDRSSRPPARRQKPAATEPSEDSWLNEDFSSYNDAGDQSGSYDAGPNVPAALPPRSRKSAKTKNAATAPSSPYEYSSGANVSSPRHSSGVNGSVITGILMIIGSIVWFFGGLAVGIIFFYPPIMLVLGIIALGKGLMGRD